MLNTLARVVTNTRRAEHIHPVLASLHWLPIKCRIDYKVATLVYNIRSTGRPAYLLPSVSDYANQATTFIDTATPGQTTSEN